MNIELPISEGLLVIPDSVKVFLTITSSFIFASIYVSKMAFQPFRRTNSDGFFSIDLLVYIFRRKLHFLYHAFYPTASDIEFNWKIAGKREQIATYLPQYIVSITL
jgi:hypothetical protein